MNWHESVPREAKRNLRWRQALLAECEKSPKLRRAVKLACSEDIFFFIFAFGWQFNPKALDGQEIGPFLPWNCQMKAVRKILELVTLRKDGVLDKSRDMGASWLFLFILFWLSLFKKWHTSGIVSKDEDAVDAKSEDSLFWKLQFIYDRLPKWLRGTVTRRKMYMKFEETNSSIGGEASTANAFVSGRKAVVFVDEFSLIKDGNLVLSRTKAVANARFFNGTYRGAQGCFYDIAKNPFFQKVGLHWTRHPWKNQGLYRWNIATKSIEHFEYREETDEIVQLRGPSFSFPADFCFDMTGRPTGGPHPGIRSPWYDDYFKSIQEDETQMAQEQDMNPEGSVSQFYSPLLIKELIQQFSRAPYWEGELEYDLLTGMPIQFVKGAGGKIKLWLNLKDDKPPIGKYGVGIDVAAGTGKTPSCISIKDGLTGEKVLEYQDAWIEPHQLAYLAFALAHMFVDGDGEPAKIIWEHHGPGTVFAKHLWKELGHRNMYYNTMEQKLSGKVTDSPGWYKTKATALLLHSAYRKALFDRTFLNRSEKALDETLKFKRTPDGSVEHTQYVNADPSVSKENHGDVVMADALAEKACAGIDTQKKIQEKEQEESLMSPGGRRMAFANQTGRQRKWT
jgi:hypothetical protein